jgi:branched-chain amino acid transport system substrate-binding protein
MVAFGPGSTCQAGFCGEPAPCQVTANCRAQFGYGTFCQDGRCALAPADPRCNVSEPPELAGTFPTVVGDRLLIGALLQNTESQNARASAIRLAISEMNGAGGIVGFKLGVLVCRNDAEGSTSSADVSSALTRHLAGSIGVPLILGPASSGNATAALSELLVRQLPTAIISPSATSAALTTAKDTFGNQSVGLFWRTCPNDNLQVSVLAKKISKASFASVALVYQQDPYGNGIEQSFRTAWEDPQHKVTSFPFQIDAAQVNADLDKAAQGAAQLKPAAVLIAAADAKYTVTFLQSAVKAGLTAPKFFFTDGSRSKAVLLDSKLSMEVRQIVQAAAGTGPAAFDPSNMKHKSFDDAMKNKYGVTVTSFGFLSHSYDAAYVGVFGIAAAFAGANNRVAGFDGFKVATGLSGLAKGMAIDVGPLAFTQAVSKIVGGKTIDIRGLSGPLDFDSTGEAAGLVEVWRANAAFDDFETVEIVTATKL